jgi:hypothetical protein
VDRGVCRDFSLCRRIDGSPASVRHENPTQIADKWAIGWDTRQWLLQKAKIRGGEREWQPVIYIASTKEVLGRCIHEKGCTPDAAGEVFIASIPESFSDFINGAILDQKEMVV